MQLILKIIYGSLVMAIQLPAPTATYTYTTGGFYIPVLILEDSLQPGDSVPCQVAVVSHTIKLVSGTPAFTVGL